MLRKWGSQRNQRTTPSKKAPAAGDLSAVVTSSRRHMFDPEVMRLEEAAHRTRMDINRLKEHGRQVRQRRLQALDAMEMRRVTLSAVLKRLDTELNEKDVHEYGDVLASVFGERKIYAHRAIGLEALLCQFMHQMLAKQHQLKIMKTAAKSIQQLLLKHKNMYREEYYSYDALAIQLEASRMTLENTYSEVFTAQHKLLAKLMDFADCSTEQTASFIRRSPPISPIVVRDRPSAIKTSASPPKRLALGEEDDIDSNAGNIEAAMDILSVSTLAIGSMDSTSQAASGAKKGGSVSSYIEEKKDNGGNGNATMSLMERMQRRRDAALTRAANASSKSRREEAPLSSHVTVGSYNDDASSLSHHSYTSSGNQPAFQTSIRKKKLGSSSSPPTTIMTMADVGDVMLSPTPAPVLPVADNNSSKGDMSARERRRKIEKMRLASGAVRAAAHLEHDLTGESSADSVRNRLREIEELQQRKSRSFSSILSNDNSAADPDDNNMTPRRAARTPPETPVKPAVTPPPASAFMKKLNGTPETVRNEDDSSSSYETDTGHGDDSSYETDTCNETERGPDDEPQDLPDASQQQDARTEARAILAKVENKQVVSKHVAKPTQQDDEQAGEDGSESSSSYESYYTEASTSSEEVSQPKQ